ncbi:MAG: AAA family ATPase, partial [Pseudomonadales bacterium]|nr:AAA family ATPase [Pseudomonadales bacterium]
MLLSLSIRDVVLIDRLEAIFRPGLCALTGETGAGKSILLDALSLALGALLAALAGPAGAAERVLLDAHTVARRATVKGEWSQRAGAVSPLQHRGFWLVDPGDGATADGT